MLKKGFTLIELVLVMGILSMTIAIGSVGLFSSFKSVNLSATYDVLVADLRSQQARAMAGEGRSASQVATWGIKIDNDRYTLYSDSYVAGNPQNSVTLAPAGLTFASNFPGSGEINFIRGSGEILGFNTGQDSITVAFQGTTKTIKFNQYGIMIEN